jgi:hypothetical protein
LIQATTIPSIPSARKEKDSRIHEAGKFPKYFRNYFSWSPV